MQSSRKDAILLKNLIKLRYNTLGDLAKKLQIDTSTLTRKVQKPSRSFLIELKNANIPIPDEMINPSIDKLKIMISKNGVEGILVKEPTGNYGEQIILLTETIKQLREENKNLKAENYDLKKQLEGYINANKS